MSLPSRGAMSILQFAAWASIGRTKTYEEIGAGRLKTFRVGGRRLVRYEDAEAWLQFHVDASV